jgi:inner membrane protease subunit 1
MSLRNLKELTIIAKEAFSKMFLVAKSLCFLHVTNTHVFTVASVSINKHKVVIFILFLFRI